MQLLPEDQMGLGPSASQAPAVWGDSAAEPGAAATKSSPGPLPCTLFILALL